MKHFRSLQNTLTPTAAVWRWVFLLALCALTGLWAALTARLIDTQSLRLTLAALARGELWYTALFLSLICALVCLLSRSLLVGGTVTTLPALLLSLVNYYKLVMTSTPLQLTEFALAGRLGDIFTLNAKNFSLSGHTVLAFLAALLWLALLLLLSRPLRPEWRHSLPAAVVCVLLFVLLFLAGADKLVYTPLGAGLDESLNQSVSNDRCGVMLGLWRTLIRTEENPIMEGYSHSYMDYLTTQAQEELPAAAGEERTRPNLILILSESFFDVTTLPGVTYEQDPLKEFHALQAEGVSGSFHTRTVGYGTCNIELEVLTGINTTLLSREDLYSMDPGLLVRLPTVPFLLEKAGYETTMLHLFNDSIYHRKEIFQRLGFDHIYFSEDFAQVDPEAAAAPDYWAYMQEQIDGAFYSDRYMTELFIDLYEQRGDSPLFLYGISMENHTPHDAGKYAEEDYTVAFTSPLDPEDAAILLAASQGAANASQALGRLCDYLREQTEPTVVLFYGDHRPNLGLDNGTETVYSRLGLSAGLDQSQWQTEDLALLHSTSYLIWSNDPSYLPAQPGSVLDSSCNYFGLSVLDAAGVEKPLYWRMLEQLHETRMMDTLEYHLGRDGSVSRTDELLTETERSRMERMALCLHDALYGQQYVTQRLGE